MNDELQRFQELARALRAQGYSQTELANAIQEGIPITVFSTPLGPLQALVTYLKDYEKKEFSEIAENLGRSYRSIWAAYEKKGIKVPETTTYISLNIFSEKLSIMEAVVWHLHEEKRMKFSEIARLLGKDDRTVWTTWNRAQKKWKK